MARRMKMLMGLGKLWTNTWSQMEALSYLKDWDYKRKGETDAQRFCEHPIPKIKE